MDERRWEQIGGIAGIVSVALLLPTTFVVAIAGDYPAPDAPARDVIAYFRDNETIYEAALFLEAISLGLNAWFFGALRGVLDRGESRGSGLPSIAFGAGLAFLVTSLVEDAALVAALRVAVGSGSESGVEALWTFAFLANWPFGRPVLVVALVAAGVSILHSKTLPFRFGAFSFIAAAGNAVFIPTVFVDSGPYVAGGLLAHIVGSLLFELWVLTVSLAVIRTSLSARRPAHPRRS